MQRRLAQNDGGIEAGACRTHKIEDPDFLFLTVIRKDFLGAVSAFGGFIRYSAD
jgi:hypothetical protein